MGNRADDVVLNADEGEPGTFKIARYSSDARISSSKVLRSQRKRSDRARFIAICAANSRAIRSSRRAIADFAALRDVTTSRFISTSGTALTFARAALLGRSRSKRGCPAQAAFPTERGLFGEPTLIHNIETIACVPFIVSHGGDAFLRLGRGLGTGILRERAYRAPGVCELPLGISFDELACTGA